MRENFVNLSALSLAAFLVGCAAPPATHVAVTYNNHAYPDAAAALAAHQRDLDQLVAAVPVSPAPLAGRVVVVLPDRDRLRPLIRSVLAAKTPAPSTDQVEFSIDFERQILKAAADGLVKSRIFQSVQQVQRNDTVQPGVDDYEYLFSFQVQPATANVNGPWAGRWIMQKRGIAQKFNPVSDPGVAPDESIVSFVQAVRQSVLKLAGGTPAAVNVAGAGAAARRASGTGIVVAKDGMLVTNAHVVQGCTSLRVFDGSESVPAAVAAQDGPNDLALLRAEHHWPAAAQFRGGPAIRQGDDVVVLGYPLNGVLAANINLTTGSVSALAGVGNDTRRMQISAPVQPGNSGGPLLDMDGHLVGVVSSKLNALAVASLTGDIPQNVNFAIKDAIVRSFLDANHVAYATSPARHALSAADVGDSARKFTVLIECSR